MQNIQSTIDDLEVILLRLNIQVRAVDPAINLYRSVTIPINCSSPAHCFEKLISWSYSLIYESLGKQYDFLYRQSKNLKVQISSAAARLQSTIHYFRTNLQHSEFDELRHNEFVDYRQSWFQDICGKNEPQTEQDWLDCLTDLSRSLKEILGIFEHLVSTSLGGEFKNIFIEQWRKVALRTFPKFEYEKVLSNVLADYGLSESIDAYLYTERYLTDWQRAVTMLPDGFKFEKEVYSIVEKAIARGEIIPISGQDLIKNGIPQSPVLGKCIAEAKRSFYENPCGPEELIKRVLSWHENQIP